MPVERLSASEPTANPDDALRAKLDTHAGDRLGMADSPRPSDESLRREREESKRRPSTRDLPHGTREDDDTDDDAEEEEDERPKKGEKDTKEAKAKEAKRREQERERARRNREDDDEDDGEEDDGEEADDDDLDDEEDEDERPAKDAKGEQDTKGKRTKQDAARDDDGDENDDPHQPEDSDEEDTFGAAAKKFKIPTTFTKLLEKVPEAQRPEAEAALTGRLASMEAGFTRAMQEQRAYRQEESELRTQLRLAEQSPEHAFMAALRKDPAAVDRLNALLTTFDTGAKGGVKPEYDAEHAKALGAARDHVKLQQEAAERADKRAGEVEAYGQRRATQAGVPWGFVEESIALAVATSQSGDISNRDVDAIVQRKLIDYNRLRGANRREGKKQGMAELRQSQRREKDRPHGKVAKNGAGGRLPASRRERDERRERRRESAGKPDALERALWNSSKRLAPDLPDE